MTSPQAALFGFGTFVIGLALCLAILAVLDVGTAFMAGPVVGLAAAAYAAYRSAQDATG
jgi:hypothetical protein